MVAGVLASVALSALPGTVVAGAADGTLLLRDADSLLVFGVRGDVVERIAAALNPHDQVAVALGGQWVAVVGDAGGTLWAHIDGKLARRVSWPADTGSFAAPLFADGRVITFHGATIHARLLEAPKASADCVVSGLGIGPIREAFDLGGGLIAVHGDDVDHRAGPHRTMPALIDLRGCQKSGRLSPHERFPAAAGGTRATFGVGELRIHTGEGQLAIATAPARVVRLAVSPDGTRVSVSKLGGQVEVFDLRRKKKTSFSTSAPERVTALADDGKHIWAAVDTQRVEWAAPGARWESFKPRKVQADETAWLDALTLIGEGRTGEALRRIQAAPAASNSKLKVAFVWVDAVANRLSDSELDMKLGRAGIDLKQASGQRALLEVLQDFLAGELTGNALDLFHTLNRVTVVTALRPQVARLGLELPHTSTDVEGVKQHIKFLEWLGRLHSSPELEKALELERMMLSELVAP